MHPLKLALIATTLTLAAAPAAHAAVAGGESPALPISAQVGLQDIRWVCGPYDCRWVPNRWHGHRHHYRHRHHHHRHWRHW